MTIRRGLGCPYNDSVPLLFRVFFGAVVLNHSCSITLSSCLSTHVLDLSPQANRRNRATHRSCTSIGLLRRSAVVVMLRSGGAPLSTRVEAIEVLHEGERVCAEWSRECRASVRSHVGQLGAQLSSPACSGFRCVPRPRVHVGVAGNRGRVFTASRDEAGEIVARIKPPLTPLATILACRSCGLSSTVVGCDSVSCCVEGQEI